MTTPNLIVTKYPIIQQFNTTNDPYAINGVSLIDTIKDLFENHVVFEGGIEELVFTPKETSKEFVSTVIQTWFSLILSDDVPKDVESTSITLKYWKYKYSMVFPRFATPDRYGRYHFNLNSMEIE